MHIPLMKAKLCVDCDCVFEGKQCPKCSSSSFIVLSKILNKPVSNKKTILPNQIPMFKEDKCQINLS